MGSQLLLLLAILPGAFLMHKVYSMDKIEKEPINLIVKLLVGGALSTFAALILELLGTGILNMVLPPYSLVYMILENFIVVALSEEGVKYLVLKLLTWKNPAFDYSFDGIVYAVSVSLGFAILENIEYAFSYGMTTTLVRALTAVPGHAIFGIFMGCYYGIAKVYEKWGFENYRKKFAVRSLAVPVILHGFYDFMASGGNILSILVFLGFIIALDVIAYKRIVKCSKNDMLIV
ncbi:MAG: PrsW family glutamic-type intramembrane protease [Eubacteriales bacterium]|nr:PrsW family glutamic-type intramembrane protease [Eubacteriales bacterium]